MVSRTGETSEIFGPNVEEVWALVVVTKSTAEVRKSRNCRKGPILTRGRQSQGSSIGGCGVDGRGQENPVMYYGTSRARVWLGAVLGSRSSRLQTSSAPT